MLVIVADADKVLPSAFLDGLIFKKNEDRYLDFDLFLGSLLPVLFISSD